MMLKLRDGYVIFQHDHGVKSLCIETENGYKTLVKAEMPHWEEYGPDVYESKKEANESYLTDNKPDIEVPEDILNSWNYELDMSFTAVSCTWDDYTTFKEEEIKS